MQSSNEIIIQHLSANLEKVLRYLEFQEQLCIEKWYYYKNLLQIKVFYVRFHLRFCPHHFVLKISSKQHIKGSVGRFTLFQP
jgi:hypothetical protein